MRHFMCLAACAVVALAGCEKKEATPAASTVSAPASSNPEVVPAGLVSLTDESVEIGCGKCTYSMAGVNGCEAAVMVKGTPLLVTGLAVDTHEHGLCSAPKTALVSGELEGDAFVVTSLEVQ